jgi:hypothetical protein
MAAQQELKDAIRERYQAATERRERRQIPFEFGRVTGDHREHVLLVLNRADGIVRPTAAATLRRGAAPGA